MKGQKIRFCLRCGRSESEHTRPAHWQAAIGACANFDAPTAAALVRRLQVMAVEALSHEGRPIRSRLDAQTLIAAAELLQTHPAHEPPRLAPGTPPPVDTRPLEG